MSELLSKLNGFGIIALVVVVGGILATVISHIATQWRKVRLAEIAGALKQQMLEKGMSPAEIEQVLKADQRPKSGGEAVLTGNEPQDKAALVAQLAEHGYEGEDIERILNAFHGTAGPNALADSSSKARAELIAHLAEHSYEAEDIVRILRAFHRESEQSVEV
jgi:SOS response regulatory protein OraA/RecX